MLYEGDTSPPSHETDAATKLFAQGFERTRVTLRYPFYTVKTDAPAAEEFYDHMFDGERRPLCRYVPTKGCERAVGVTEWKFVAKPGEDGHGDPYGLYTATGERRTIDCGCDVQIRMPTWLNQSHASKRDQERVRAFLSATNTHERGHAAACVSLGIAVQSLVKHMPKTVPPALVPAFNTGFRKLAIEFYEVRARRADVLYDHVTCHGGCTQGAELSREDNATDEEGFDIRTFHVLPERLFGGPSTPKSKRSTPRSVTSHRSGTRKKLKGKGKGRGGCRSCGGGPADESDDESEHTGHASDTSTDSSDDLFGDFGDSDSDAESSDSEFSVCETLLSSSDDEDLYN